jgi:hypothetical protein
LYSQQAIYDWWSAYRLLISAFSVYGLDHILFLKKGAQIESQAYSPLIQFASATERVAATELTPYNVQWPGLHSRVLEDLTKITLQLNDLQLTSRLLMYHLRFLHHVLPPHRQASKVTRESRTTPYRSHNRN